MKKKIATAMLVLTLSAGIASADCITPTRHMSKQQTWTQKVERLVQYVRNLWF